MNLQSQLGIRACGWSFSELQAALEMASRLCGSDMTSVSDDGQQQHGATAAQAADFAPPRSTQALA